MLSRPVFFAIALACAASCAGFKSADGQGDDSGAAGDGAAGADGALQGDSAIASGSDGATSSEGGGGGMDATLPGSTGAGPWGALPYGYCCTQDDQCRTRNCLTIGASKSCGDVCRTDEGCTGGLPGYHCVGGSMFVDGHCEPVQPTTSCTPLQSFVYGTKKLGECCTPTHNGGNARECEGGHCDSFGSINNPYICINVCTRPSDCPGSFSCRSTGSYSICVPDGDPFTCR